MASRVPEAIVNERRSKAKKQAKQKGYTPSQAHLPLMAWNLCMTKVPHTLWKPATGVNVSPLRWPIALIVKSWKSDLHVAVLTTTQEDPTLWYLDGRVLLMVLTYALCPQMRAHLWGTQRARAEPAQNSCAISRPWQRVGCRRSFNLHAHGAAFSPTACHTLNGWWRRP